MGSRAREAAGLSLAVCPSPPHHTLSPRADRLDSLFVFLEEPGYIARFDTAFALHAPGYLQDRYRCHGGP